MLVREAFIQFIESKGVRFLFHLPGIHTLPINDTISRSKIRAIVGRHESNVGFMADGFSRATGGAGVVLVTPGPGVGNLVSACMEAHADDVPLIIVFIDVERKDVEKGLLHGVPALETLFLHIAKGTYVVLNEKDILPQLEEAYRLATTPRQGAVVISIAYDILDRTCPTSALAARVAPDRDQRPYMDPAPLKEGLKGKERPVIIAGKALMESGAGPLLERLCARSRIPLLTTVPGKGVVREDSEWVFGNVASKGVARELLMSSDAVLAIGTRLRDVDTRRRGVKIRSLIHIDVDGQWMGKNYETASALTGDMTAAIEALCQVMEGTRSSWDMEGLRAVRQWELAAMERNHVGFRIIQALRRVVPEEATTVWDLSMLGYWAENWFPVFRERSFLCPRGVSPTFYGVPASVGAKLGRSDEPCLCVTGDGSFLPTVSELATMRAYGVPVVVLVYNNSSFGVLEHYMERRYGMKDSMKLQNPDMVSLAKAFDIEGRKVDTPEQLERAFRVDVRWDRPFLIEFCYPLFPPPW